MVHSRLIAMTVIFFVHFIFFLQRALRRKRIHFISATMTFLMLTLYGATRLLKPEFMLFGHPAYIYLRIWAWCASALTLGVYLQQRRNRLKSR